ncbi:phosphonate ABC transporter ATP-binding protein [Demequina pelophila]|uniref:phosphonate ABC transporter ATP-binding protein n=1 Tax=Demequina pelophila TaxID=1638984 RepID=UPI0007816742|nr:phosphonate ABC transporter ATP-binding protein [Demequina pelophila]
MADHGTAVIRTRELVKQFDTTTALNGVTVDITPGEVVVLLGLSGSGKSTLLRHFNGLEAATSGSVEVLGQDLSTLGGRGLRGLRRRVSMVFQQFELVGPLSVLENVCSGALGSLRGPRLGLLTYPTAVRRRALDNLERVGLGDRAFQRADTLSGGQQQRVAIARALMQDPEILLADEPVASLDPESATTVMALIREIARERELTVVCSLHQVELALEWGDRLLGLRAGELVLETSTQGLTKERVMAIYRSVATDEAQVRELRAELSAQDAAQQLVHADGTI